jgi:hypothetical protein
MTEEDLKQIQQIVDRAVEPLTAKIETLGAKIETLGAKVETLGANVEAYQANFETLGADFEMLKMVQDRAVESLKLNHDRAVESLIGNISDSGMNQPAFRSNRSAPGGGNPGRLEPGDLRYEQVTDGRREA